MTLEQADEAIRRIFELQETALAECSAYHAERISARAMSYTEAREQQSAYVNKLADWRQRSLLVVFQRLHDRYGKLH